MWDASLLCVCVRARESTRAFASAHVHVNLGLIIKALLLADAQTGWQTSRQANTEHSSAGVFLSFYCGLIFLLPLLVS